MHVLVVNYTYEPAPSPAALLERYRSLTGWAEGVQGAGARVSVLQRYDRSGYLRQGEIDYHFVRDPFPCHPRLWQIPASLHRLARTLDPALIHVNGLLFPAQLRALRRAVPGAVLVVQHHAEGPMWGWRGWLQRWGLRAADAFFFVSREQAAPWQARQILPPRASVFEVMEGSTRMAPLPRAGAREQSGLHGAPALLWVGRLDGNKDPLTVLEGVAHLRGSFPELHLWMIFSEERLLPQVQARLRADPRLAGAVTLVGKVEHERMAAFYSGAELFVLGSHHEGSGFALIEALACGLPPVVTDIPSFRVLTDGGRVGALWRAGDPASLCRAASALLAEPLLPQRLAARRLFVERWSIPAIGRRAVDLYRSLVAAR